MQFERHVAPIERIYFSPYLATAGTGDYLMDEDARKLSLGMLLRGKHELGLSLKNFVLVGYRPSDILAGVAAGEQTNSLLSANICNELAGIDYLPVRAIKDAIPYLEGADWVLTKR